MVYSVIKLDVKVCIVSQSDEGFSGRHNKKLHVFDWLNFYNKQIIK